MCLEVGIADFHRVFTGVVLSRIVIGNNGSDNAMKLRRLDF